MPVRGPGGPCAVLLDGGVTPGLTEQTLGEAAGSGWCQALELLSHGIAFP